MILIKTPISFFVFSSFINLLNRTVAKCESFLTRRKFSFANKEEKEYFFAFHFADQNRVFLLLLEMTYAKNEKKVGK